MKKEMCFLSYIEKKKEIPCFLKCIINICNIIGTVVLVAASVTARPAEEDEKTFLQRGIYRCREQRWRRAAPPE